MSIMQNEILLTVTVPEHCEGSHVDASNKTSPDVSRKNEALAQFLLLQLKQGDGEDD